jgi:HK97 family phage portal protein
MTAAIRNGAAIRGVLSYTGLSKESKLQEMRDQFKATYLTPENSGGVVVVDNSAVYTPIKQEPVILSADQQKVIKSKILDFLGLPDAILNSSFDENAFAAFCEGVVEPFALQMGLEFTAKIFTPREIAYGNEIRFDYSRLYVSNSSKIALIKEMTPFGLLSINEGRAIFDLPPVPGGDRRLQTLNVVDAGRANEYQLEDDKK